MSAPHRVVTLVLCRRDGAVLGALLAASVTALLERLAGELDPEPAARLAALVDGRPARFAALAACGLPDTLVHGDFHPGNARAVPGSDAVLLDRGDSGVGHPLLDVPAFLERVPETDQREIRAVWAESWRAARPGADPERAAELIAPLAAARRAVVHQGFLDRIEPAEHVYHARDPVDWLHLAVEW